MNIVLDTNTVISGLFWKGAPRQVLDLARSGTFTLFTSPELLAELGRVLERQKFSARLALANLSVEELVLGYASLAITVRPQKIASGDSHLLDLNEYEGIKILTVNQLLERYI
jgi:putative PIN family toxin of toxin-antitoxin system